MGTFIDYFVSVFKKFVLITIFLVVYKTFFESHVQQLFDFFQFYFSLIFHGFGKYETFKLLADIFLLLLTLRFFNWLLATK